MVVSIILVYDLILLGCFERRTYPLLARWLESFGVRWESIGLTEMTWRSAKPKTGNYSRLQESGFFKRSVLVRAGTISSVAVVLGGLIILGAAIFGFRIVQRPAEQASQPSPSAAETARLSVGAGEDSGKLTSLHPIVINRPAGPPKLDSGTVDSSGNPIFVECSVCHATRAPNFENRISADLKEFHRDIQVFHGTVTCLSCHHADDYQSLRLADGSRVEFENVMQLCGQCHGPQLRDYQHGAHGGMNGHWDLSRGQQFKNNCVDCHQPHHPKFPHMQTGFKPRDRFLPTHATSSKGEMHD